HDKKINVYDEDMIGNLWINIYPKNIVDLTKSVSAITMEDTRFFHCNIKTLNLIPAVMANQEAKKKGCFEAIFHRNGRVTECAHSNVHIIKNGVFKTAPLDNLILPGTTRRHLIDRCGELGIPVEEKEFYLDELFDADEIIVSSAGALCVRVRELDGKEVGGKAEELITKLQKVMLEHFYEATK
ncbi:MAG: aminotransferase class IV, partial [Clostridia bacterium]|nr:aminotransferase class IV [Clostridia bacterium]